MAATRCRRDARSLASQLCDDSLTLGVLDLHSRLEEHGKILLHCLLLAEFLDAVPRVPGQSALSKGATSNPHTLATWAVGETGIVRVSGSDAREKCEGSSAR